MLINNLIINKFKKKNFIFIYFIMYFKYYIFFKNKIYLYLIKCLLNIKFNKKFSISYLSENFIDKK